tara:strand:+ start:204 stop:1352 length:1149 start_codon:yes stop_codon:yes gene_type:complete
MFFYNNLKFYLLSFITLILQFLFLAIIKEFENDFNHYIQIMAINSLLISFIGSIQFYFEQKKNLITLKFYKKTLIILIITIVLIACYYFFVDLRWFSFFLTSIASLIFFTINTAHNARFNKFNKNTKLLLNYSLIKFLSIYVAYKNNFDIVYLLVFSNIVVILLSSKIIKNIYLILNKENSFSIKSVINNILGTGNTTLDKLYCTNFATLIAANYFIIFKVASVFQYFTEVIFRKERFMITEGKLKIDNKIIFIKFITLFISIICLNLFIDQFEKYLNYYSHLEINFIISFLKIIVLYNNEFTLIAFAFLINSVSGLTYDKIYRNFGNNYLIYVNLINVVLLTIFLFQFGSTLSNLAIIFFSVHLINYFLIKILEIYLKKKI